MTQESGAGSKVVVLEMSKLSQNGVWLAWGVMALILIFGATLLGMIWSVEPPTPSGEIHKIGELLVSANKQYIASGDTKHLTTANELLNQAAGMRRASRDFWISLAQMFLLNMLLPVLTAILGYVFGTKQGSQ